MSVTYPALQTTKPKQLTPGLFLPTGSMFPLLEPNINEPYNSFHVGARVYQLLTSIEKNILSYVRVICQKKFCLITNCKKVSTIILFAGCPKNSGSIGNDLFKYRYYLKKDFLSLK